MQNDEVKISVIMPVYNVKDYIERAVRSVLNQSFKDFELFLVDDGSTDDSGNICDELEKNDNRIKVIHQKNSGAHVARNNALKLARGTYVCFFDSDDYIDEDMLLDLYTLAIKNNSDLVVSGFYIHTYYDDNNYITLNYIPSIDELDNKMTIDKYEYFSDTISGIEVYNNSNYFRKFAYKHFDKNMFYSPWNKLYKLSYIKNNKIEFPLTYRDDFPFVLKVIRDIEKVTFTTKQYYHFIRKRSDSETQKYVDNLYDKREEEHALMNELYNYWCLNFDNSSIEMVSRRYIDRLIECMVNLFNEKCTLDRKGKLDTINKYLNSDNVNNAIKFARPKKNYLKMMYKPIQSKNVLLCYMMASFINTFKKNNIKIFSILKTNR